MNARAWRGLFVTLAILLATTSFAFGASIRITAPTNNGHIDLGFTATVAETAGNVTFTFTVTTGSGADQIRLVIDQMAPITFAATQTSRTVNNLPAGAHHATVYLLNGAGTPYAGAVAVTRFYLSRVCGADGDCTDADPCSTQFCFGGATNTGSWFGRCRFGPDPGDADCCVTSEWCRQKGLSLDDYGTQYQCSDVDADTIGDCVQCTLASQCQAVINAEVAADGLSCKTAPQCNAAHTCTFTAIPNCCVTAAQCNDGNSCTVDSCDAGTGVCSHAAVANCCIPGHDDQALGAPNYGCRPASPDLCTYYTCLGTGATAECRSGPKYGGCCTADTQCTDATQLNACTDNDGLGYGDCQNIGADARFPGAGTCAYPKINAECCIKNYQCAGRYPEFIGTCIDQAGEDWNICSYAANPDFCVSPVTSIVVNEVMVNPGGPPGNVIADYFGEWFEVFNPTNTDINMDGWTIEDLGEGLAKQSFTIDNAGFFNVPAGGFRIFVRNNNPGSNGTLPRAGYAWPADDFSLENDTDQIVVKNQAGTVQDQVAYDTTWPWTEQASMALINPYLDNALKASWARSKFPYGEPIYENLGTPTLPNLDVFNEAATSGETCDDSNPCTLDICNLDKADICSHKKMRDCCTAATAATACNDLNACTVDSCNATTNACVHTTTGNCCVADADCVDWYPTEIDSANEEELFDLCAYKVCIGNSCRYGRNLARPDCCVAADSTSFGCFDRNICTADVCVADGGQDAAGITFAQCLYDLDTNNDNINDCCRLPEDCNDGNPSTIDTCDMVDDGQGPGVNRCWYKPDILYCGPGSANPTCDDGDVCTTDYCCTGIDAPHGDCPAANRCVHPRQANCCASAQNCVDGLACTTDSCVAGVCQHQEVAAGCCEVHADCNGAGKPADMYCRTGYCIGKVCRYGPPIAGCCVTPADCSPTTCTSYTCTNHSCQSQQVANCCITGADCAPSTAPCKSNVCMQNQCTEIDLPGCCQDTNANGPDPSCNDTNPCTSDYCMLQGGALQCRYFPVGGAGCCNTVDMCPDDSVQCTAVACASNVCELEPAANCLTVSPYRMTFTEGHSVYVGEYAGVSDLAWSTTDLGANAAVSFFAFRTAGALGPDRYLAFKPTATVANFDSCVVLPRFRTNAMSNATVGFDWAADWVSGSVTLRILGRAGTGWTTAPEVWKATITADAAATHVNAALPAAILNSDQTQLAICVAGASTASLAEALVDEVVISQGQAPSLADITSKSVTKGQTKTFPDAFVITEQDVDENIALTLLNAPGAWVKVVNVRKLTGVDTQWMGDLQVTGAVCPSSSPYNYSLKVKASDGALEVTKSFVLVVNGCP